MGHIAWHEGHAQTPSQTAQPTFVLPEHLPKRLSIGLFIWNWIAMSGPGEPYEDLEKAVAGLAERGFNAVRVEAGFNWCFRADGQPRGEVEFAPFFPQYGDNIVGSGKGGVRHDVLKRVIRLMELAQQYGIWVILSSWEYQDSTCLLADPKIRAEVLGIAEEQRFMVLAQHHDRLLQILEQRGLHRNVAYVEVHNEPEFSLLPGGQIGSKCADGQVGKKLHADAIAFLRNAHPDILVSADHATHDPSIVPDNAQVYDQHTYVGFYGDLWGQMLNDFDPANPLKSELLRRLLKDPVVPYDQFVKSMPLLRSFWYQPAWLYHNLDNRRFDQWALEQFAQKRQQLKASAVGFFENDSKEATRRGVPAVCDEGGYFWPPLGSQFELTEPGMSLFDFQTDLAIKHGYWGMMPTTYCGPEMPLWNNVTWLSTVNKRFQTGRTKST